MVTLPIPRNEAELSVIRQIASSEQDRPVLMLNLNRYTTAAGYPHGDLYLSYVLGLEAFLPSVGAKVLWRMPVLGQAVGVQPIDEILAAWYPSHQAFLDLPNASGASENYRLRGLCVEAAVIHRCPGDTAPFAP